jgi:peptidoglycan-associated lipoprotein
MSTSTTLRVAVSFFSVVTLAGSIGCAHERPRAVSVQTMAAQIPRADQEVAVSDDIRKACNIEEDPKTPKFDFDSNALSQVDRDVLVQVARCLTTGPLKGRSVETVGRADSRGETEYNMTLGESRAAAVHSYLGNLGVSKAKMSITSRGELDATGKDEDGWRLDRRVDLRLKNQDIAAK